jgi:hypothetical protein
MSLIKRACEPPGKALAVFLVVWRLARVKKSKTFVLTQAALTQLGISRWEKYDALESLEKAGLISVHRRPKKNPEITLLVDR